MLPYSQIVGKQEWWANWMTNVQTLNQPFLAWCPMGPSLVQAEELYQAESWKDPARNSHPDGVTVVGATSAGDQRVSLRSVIQYSTKAANVSVLTQKLGNNAAVDDVLGAEITKQSKELANDMECAMLSAQECRVGVTGTTGYMTRSVNNWILRSAQSVYPVDSSQYPALASQIDTSTASSSLTEDSILDILEGIGTTTESSETVTCFAGPKLRRKFNNFPVLTSGSTSTVNGGAYPSPVRGGAFDRGIHRYTTPFGFDLDLVTSYRNYKLDANGVVQAATTAISHSGYFLHQSKWKLSWGVFKGGSGMPQWTTKPYEGGKYEAFCEQVWMLQCLSPKGEGRYTPAS